MGKIADKAKKTWREPGGCGFKFENIGKAIDSEFEALRQEIQVLKKDIYFKEYKKPEPELQRGDFVSYIWKYRDKIIWGVFHHQIGDEVWAYWQNTDGSFPGSLGLMYRDRVTFEFRPEK